MLDLLAPPCAGYLVVLPDLLHGKALELGSFDRSKFGEWLQNFPREKVLKDCFKVIDALKAEHGIKNVGVEGFCWGGLYAILLAGPVPPVPPRVLTSDWCQNFVPQLKERLILRLGLREKAATCVAESAS
jgi:dienelactone hydrolase